MQKPFAVTIEFEKNTAGPNRPPVLEWDTRTETVWATSLAEVRRVCRGRFGVIPMTITPLWDDETPPMTESETKDFAARLKPE